MYDTKFKFDIYFRIPELDIW